MGKVWGSPQAQCNKVFLGFASVCALFYACDQNLALHAILDFDCGPARWMPDVMPAQGQGSCKTLVELLKLLLHSQRGLSNQGLEGRSFDSPKPSPPPLLDCT